MMRTILVVSTLAALTTAAPAGIGDPVPYRLDDAAYVEGCFGKCLCPLWYTPLAGTFVLTPVSITGTFNEYEVSEIDWVIDLLNDDPDIPVTGSGTYTVFSEVVTQDRMELDLSISGGPVTQFSRDFEIAAGEFPEILISVSVGDLVCYDQVVTVRAFPITPDIDRDGQVGVNDLIAVVEAWGTDDPWADVTMDGTVNVMDLVAVIQAWD